MCIFTILQSEGFFQSNCVYGSHSNVGRDRVDQVGQHGQSTLAGRRFEKVDVGKNSKNKCLSFFELSSSVAT